MKYNELQTNPHKSAKRVGRGIAGGQGKTAGRGTKGQNARTGNSTRPGFAGGQNPLMQQMPKLRGFNSKKPVVEVVYTSQVNTLPSTTITNSLLAEAGLVSTAHGFVKLIVKGAITKKLTISVQSASNAAIEAVQKAGGTVTLVPRVNRAAKKPKQ